MPICIAAIVVGYLMVSLGFVWYNRMVTESERKWKKDLQLARRRIILGRATNGVPGPTTKAKRTTCVGSDKDLLYFNTMLAVVAVCLFVTLYRWGYRALLDDSIVPVRTGVERLAELTSVESLRSYREAVNQTARDLLKNISSCVPIALFNQSSTLGDINNLLANSTRYDIELEAISFVPTAWQRAVDNLETSPL